MIDIFGLIEKSWDATIDQKIAALNDFCDQLQYCDQVLEENGETVPNPETKKQFANRKTLEYISDTVNKRREVLAASKLQYDQVRIE